MYSHGKRWIPLPHITVPAQTAQVLWSLAHLHVKLYIIQEKKNHIYTEKSKFSHGTWLHGKHIATVRSNHHLGSLGLPERMFSQGSQALMSCRRGGYHSPWLPSAKQRTKAKDCAETFVQLLWASVRRAVMLHPTWELGCCGQQSLRCLFT